jgi:hypothetical protein
VRAPIKLKSFKDFFRSSSSGFATKGKVMISLIPNDLSLKTTISREEFIIYGALLDGRLLN